MRIARVSVTNLFGTFDHSIDMKLDKRITIIHGPNGYGKTSLLKLLNGLLAAKYTELRSVPFDRFQVDFDDGNYMRVDKLPERPRSSRKKKVTPEIRISSSNSEPWVPPSAGELETSFSPSLIDRVIPEIARVGVRAWRNTDTGEILDLEEVLERYDSFFPAMRRREPEWLKQMQSKINIRFIETQRLLSLQRVDRHSAYEGVPSMVSAVTIHAEHLKGAIQATLGEYAALSQSLDRTFPVRLVRRIQSAKPDTSLTFTNEELRERLAALEARRSKLREAGLLDKEEGVTVAIPSTLDNNTARVLSVYVKDVEQKLSVFDDLASKIDLFKQVINDHFQYKEMKISKEAGFTFVTRDGEPLPATALSSGEQNELVLVSELLFRVGPGSLILIDEPEISLHVEWQEQFLKDLQNITNLAFFDVLIATHSPQIIYDRWDLTVELSGPEGD